MSRENAEIIIAILEKGLKELKADFKKMGSDINDLANALNSFKHNTELRHVDLHNKVVHNEQKVNKHEKILGWVAALVAGILLTAWLTGLLK